MFVYHGTTLEIDELCIIRQEKGRDFGFGFYTTDLKDQAERWARRRAKLLRRVGYEVEPVVNVYEYKQNDVLNTKVLRYTDEEWLDMVLKCRGNSNYNHGYDIVIGKIANDNVGETVSFVLQGIMRKEDAIERLKFEKINNQVVFCSDKALKTLTFVESYICE